MAPWLGPFSLLVFWGCAGSGARPTESPKTTNASESTSETPARSEQQHADPLTDSFTRGEFENVISACQSLQDDPSSGARAWCAGLVPASLYALGRDGEALVVIAGVCGRMPAASAASNARAGLIALVMVGLAEANRGGHFERSDAQRSDLLSSWLTACEVSESEVRSVVERLNRGEAP